MSLGTFLVNLYLLRNPLVLVLTKDPAFKWEVVLIITNFVTLGQIVDKGTQFFFRK